MKKLLGISLVAALAVSPMMANAAGSAIAAATATANNADNSAVATAAYVKGAYNAIRGDIHVTADGTYIHDEDSVAENLGNLDTAIGTFTNASENAIIDNENSVGTNLKALETAINTGNSGVNGKIGTISDGSAVIDGNGTLMINDTDSIGTNLGHIDTKIGNVTDRTDGKAIIHDASSVSANLTALESAVVTNTDNIGNMSNLTGGENSLVEAIEAVRDSAADANAANTIVVYSGWNGGAAPANPGAITTMTAEDADEIINPGQPAGGQG